MSFVGEVAGVFGVRAAYPNLDAWTKRLLNGLHTRRRSRRVARTRMQTD